jgi:hypothetical protein
VHFWHDDALKNAKAEIVVAVAGVVVVAISRPAVPGVVVPATAADDPVGTINDRYPSEGHPIKDILPKVICVRNL